MLLHKGMLGLVVLQLWTSEAVLSTESRCDTNVQRNILWLLKCSMLKANCEEAEKLRFYEKYINL
jgi:hypothetical protein